MTLDDKSATAVHSADQDEKSTQLEAQRDAANHAVPEAAEAAEAGEVAEVAEATAVETPEKKPMPLSRSLILVIILASSSFLNTSITQACVIVLPTIGRDLDIPPGRQQWVLSASSLAYACTLLLWGRIADICGRRVIFQLGIACVCLSCLIAPFAPEEVSFDIFRALQGLGGAAATPSAVGIIFGVFPSGKAQIYAMSAYSAGFPLGNVTGNILGGVIAEFLSWRWIFWIMAIASATSCGLSLIFVPPLPKDIQMKSTPLRQRIHVLHSQMDWLGLLMSMALLMFLLVSLTDGNVVGWTSPRVLTLLIISVVIFPAYIFWETYLERRAKRPPLMKLSVFSNSRVYCAAQAICFIFWASFNNFLVFATYFYQNYQGLNTIQTTLRFLPSGITGVITVFITSQILNHVDGYVISLWGTACITIACLLFAVPIPPNTIYWAYGFPAMIILTLGADTLFPVLSIFIMRSIPEEDQGIGAAIFQTVGQVGRSVGLAIATAIQIAVTNSGGANDKEDLLRGYRAADYFSFAIGLISFLVAASSFKGAGKLGKKKTG